MSKSDDLSVYVFDGRSHLLSDALAAWMEDSSRFTAFVETYRDKIRKKIRLIRESESALDLRSELEVAYCLLKDRRLDVAYEPYAGAKRRGADFAVTYRRNLVFNIEVARIRVEADGVAGNSPDLRRREERVVRILVDKLEQMQPGMANLLVIHTHAGLARAIDLERLMQQMKIKVENRDPAFYALTRSAGPAAFYKEFHRLSAILFWAQGAQPWVNKQARSEISGALLRLVCSLSPDEA